MEGKKETTTKSAKRSDKYKINPELFERDLIKESQSMLSLLI